jgi:hypothetical protein
VTVTHGKLTANWRTANWRTLQPILAKDIPAVPISADGSDDGVVRVISGPFIPTPQPAPSRAPATRFDPD